MSPFRKRHSLARLCSQHSMNKKVHCFDHQENSQVSAVQSHFWLTHGIFQLGCHRRARGWSVPPAPGFPVPAALLPGCSDAVCTLPATGCSGLLWMGTQRCPEMPPWRRGPFSFGRHKTQLKQTPSIFSANVADLQVLLRKLESDLFPLGRLKYTVFACG